MSANNRSGSVGGRADRLAAAVAEDALDQLLVTELQNVEYLTGFTGTNGACIIGPGRRQFLTDFRYAERAEEEVKDWDVKVLSGEWLGGLVDELEGRVGFEDDHVSVRTARQYGERIGEGVELVEAGGMVERLRRVKDETEIAAIAAAAQLTDRIYVEAIERGMLGRTEADVANFAVARMREEGAEPSFPPIVAAGANGALPHAEPAERVIGSDELIVFDMGSKLDGYCSDCTRTFATGDPDSEAREIYDVTLEAQLTSLAAIKSGVDAATVDKVARDIIASAGYGDRFGHGLGHGVGIEIHEAPRLGPRSEEVLVSGDIVTVEPGIYLPGKSGVRIEDMVEVGESGITRNFSTLDKQLTFVS
jgi:Xaa-Pro aminopeptidase